MDSSISAKQGILERINLFVFQFALSRDLEQLAAWKNPRF